MNRNASVVPGELIETGHGRRSFLYKAGAALSALTAAAIPAVASEAPRIGNEDEALIRRARAIEDEREIRQLHQLYGASLGQGDYEKILELFVEDGTVSFNGGLFIGRDKGVRRLYVSSFGRALSELSGGPVHRYQVDRVHPEDAVTVAADGRTATARFQCLLKVAARDTTRYPMMDLARAQGQGVLEWWEDGLYEVTYRKIASAWKIETLSYRPQGLAPNLGGWSSVAPEHLPAGSRVYPEDPLGPDKLISSI